MWIIRDLLSPMMKRNSGQIVTISSLAGVSGLPGMTDYAASKAASFMFTEALRMELKYLGKNIKCSTIAPYFTNTGMFEGVKPTGLFQLQE